MLSNAFYFKLLPSVLLLAGPSGARQWLQKSNIQGNGFLDTYTFFDGPDPTHGSVNFAQGPMLTWVDDYDRFNMKVSTTQKVRGNRGSVRISSNYPVGDGVIIANITHVPTGCAVWPAFWTLGEGQWPSGGEIDILEWANDAEWEDGVNTISLHTGPGCAVDEGDDDSTRTSPNQLGRLLNGNCHTGGASGGCSVRAKPNTKLGTAAEAFNAQGGGVVAMERDLSWGGKGVRVWQWARNDTDSIPFDVSNSSFFIDTSKWGTPVASFNLNSNCKQSFNDHQIIFDITLGGVWAKGAWNGGACAQRHGNIENFISNSGSSFDEAYWSIDSVMHYV